MGALVFTVVLAATCPTEGVVRDAAALTTALAGPARDVWVAGTIDGDFVANRSVAVHGCDGARLRGTGRGTVLTVKGDDVVIEDLALERSGGRVSAEDGALPSSVALTMPASCSRVIASSVASPSLPAESSSITVRS